MLGRSSIEMRCAPAILAVGHNRLRPATSRRFHEPADGHLPDENAFDGVLEIWYKDQSAYERWGVRLSRPEVRAGIAARERPCSGILVKMPSIGGAENAAYTTYSLLFARLEERRTE